MEQALAADGEGEEADADPVSVRSTLHLEIPWPCFTLALPTSS